MRENILDIMPHSQQLYNLGLAITIAGLGLVVLLCILVYILRYRLAKKLDQAYGKKGGGAK